MIAHQEVEDVAFLDYLDEREGERLPGGLLGGIGLPSAEVYQLLSTGDQGAIVPPRYPLGTISTYGPDKRTVTRIQATLVPKPGVKAARMSWSGADLIDNAQVREEIRRFFSGHRVQSIVVSDGNLGCPHEEGEDFLPGEECPFCPHWTENTTEEKHVHAHS